MTSIEQRFAQGAEPLAGMIFMAPEALEAYGALGLNWFQGYFCSRTAALGRTAPEVVMSTFYSFYPGSIRRAVGSGWTKATPEQVSEARFAAAGKALRRMLVDAAGAPLPIDEAAGLLWRLVENAPSQGRPLYAAHLAQPRRTDPHESLWQATNLLREFRGDSHIAVLVAADVGPVESILLYAAMLGRDPAHLMVGPQEWPADDVAAALKRLAARGYAEGGSITEAGIGFRREIEDLTDSVSSAPYRALGDEADRAIAAVRPLSGAVARAGR